MHFLEISGCILALLCLWVLPIWLGLKAARRNHRSPHWMWFGVHPFGAWIAFLVLQFAAPLKACAQCGERVKSHARICPYCTTPFEEALTTPVSAPATGKKRWLYLGGLAAAGAVGIAGFFLFTLGMVESAFKDSGAYQQAIQKAAADPRVVQLLGFPVQGGGPVGGSISTRGDASGEADMSIPISGPNGEARLYASGRLHAGVWTWQTLEVDPKQGQPRINLLTSH